MTPPAFSDPIAGKMSPKELNAMRRGRVLLEVRVAAILSRVEQQRLGRLGRSQRERAEVNPDADAASNYAEFLAGTGPLISAEHPASAISVTGPSVTLEMDLPANRWFQVESSPNLVDWLLWDVPGNHGLQWPGGRAALTGTVEHPHHFFRFVIGENDGSPRP